MLAIAIRAREHSWNDTDINHPASLRKPRAHGCCHSLEYPGTRPLLAEFLQGRLAQTGESTAGDLPNWAEPGGLLNIFFGRAATRPAPLSSSRLSA
jgi:hypothetical protein